LIKAMERKVARTIEKKGVDGNMDISAGILETTNTNSNIFVPVLVSPGTASYNRVGRKIQLRSLRVRGVYELESGSTSVTVRMVIVWDKQPSGVLPTFDIIFGSTAQDGTESSDVLDALRYDNMDRFQILRDVVVSLTPQGYAGSAVPGLNQYVFDEYVKLTGKETVYSAQNTPCTIADVSSGGLYVIFRATDRVSGVREVNTAFTTYRLRYTD